MRYLSVGNTTKKWQVSERSIHNYCTQGRIQEKFLTSKLLKFYFFLNLLYKKAPMAIIILNTSP